MTREQVKAKILDAEYWEIIYLSDKSERVHEVIRLECDEFKVHTYTDKTFFDIGRVNSLDELMIKLDNLHYDYDTAEIDGC